MTLAEFMQLQPTDRIVIRFARGQQKAIVVRRVNTRSGDAVWISRFDAYNHAFIDVLTRVGPGKVIRRCDPAEFTAPYTGEIK